MATINDLKRPEDRVVLQITSPHCLYFALKRVSRRNHRNLMDFIIEILQGAGTKTPQSADEILVNHFVDFYPYPMKDKIAGAKRPRSFTFITTRSHRDNIKQLAVTNDMNMTEFIVKVLTEKMAQELQEKTIVEVHNN